jgi:hypothetical protein
MGQRFASFVWLCPFLRDYVVVKGDSLHTKLCFAGLDLDARPLAAANESLKEFI